MQLIVKVAGFGKSQNLKWEIFRLGAFRLNFVAMETITITVKTKKAKRIIEDLAALDVLTINKKGAEKSLEELPLIDPKKADLKWLDPKKKPHARRILRSLRDAQLAAQGKIQLKSAKELLDEL
jgi:hypothetical protein